MKEFKSRLLTVSIILAQAFLIIVLRLWYMQILKGSEFEKFSNNNRISVTKFPAPRGRILDQRGRELAINRSSFDVYAVPNDITGIDAVSNILSSTLGIEPSIISEKITKAHKENRFKPTLIADDINRDQLAFIEARRINLTGVFIHVDHKRTYPYGKLAASLLGYLGRADKDDLKLNPNLIGTKLVGKYGVENTLEKYLRGEDGFSQRIIDAYGREVNWDYLERDLKNQDSVTGSDIYLTIDLDLQRIAEETLGERSGAIVALNVKTGEVLALVSQPTFDPEFFVHGLDQMTWNKLMKDKSFPLLNRATQGLYAPGSVFKIVTSSAALKEGIIDEHTRFYCPGSYRIGKSKFRCWKKGGHGSLNLHQAIVRSCDVFFYNVAERLGISRFSDYIRGFGFGSPTGIELNERQGVAPSIDWKFKNFRKPWYLGETIVAGIGQGYISVTPLQIAVMTASIANGGILLKPQVVKKVVSPNGEVLLETNPEEKGRIPVGQEIITIMMDALVGVVNEPGGTGGAARLDSVIVAGKTGTAQVISLDSKITGLELNDHAWFTSYAPGDNPEIVVTVLVEHGGRGGAVAAPVAKEIIKAYMRLKEEGNV